MDTSTDTISASLLAWYEGLARVLPWRSPPGTPPPDPYRVWLSEVMLQQTTVAAVGPYFAKFLARWPTVKELAAADDAEVMAAWAGLGYYARARNLLACARAVAARGGAFPGTEAELRELPGLGAYTAAAVAAIAFGERATVVDANVERVVARLFAIDEPLPAARKAIRARAEELTPAERPGDFAQAMMDLGATVCTNRNPRCLLCPLAANCAGRRAGAERFPVKPAKAAKAQRRGCAFWIERGGAVWLVQRPNTGMLGGMRALPDDGWAARSDGCGEGPLPGEWRAGGVVRHAFTHFDLDLQLMLYSGGDLDRLASDNGEWWPLDRIDEAGLPTLFAKAARLALAERETGE
ncbi:A/G-specific adenine glycosylase [Novosphingobium ginsenosidimutans]|uniref:Adenine DNA glycosylase n=1 Tax=Novosphingobium ginsenosidimutans TaxID=1176536 RepID=A0A5B8S0D8_9SPHN|nr:A/G-specific adenine glycosylase [Novosphingobium ginsenosidimutans]QEA15046.1 A/G-specific adenine glycosylase [Novosphingobium ginsenosidimutans]